MNGWTRQLKIWARLGFGGTRRNWWPYSVIWRSWRQIENEILELGVITCLRINKEIGKKRKKICVNQALSFLVSDSPSSSSSASSPLSPDVLRFRAPDAVILLDREPFASVDASSTSGAEDRLLPSTGKSAGSICPGGAYPSSSSSSAGSPYNEWRQ